MYMNYYIYILFIPMMFISIMLTMITNSWISLWMIMELSLISMIMLLLFDKLINYELLMKYFLFQSFQSYLYLINTLGLSFETMFNISIIMMNLSILMKLSLFPFHFWYIKIMNKLNWNNIYFFSILNKLIPLFIMNNIFNLNIYLIKYINYFLLLISSFFSSILGMNQINMKLIMSYSSMIQISWVIILMNFNELMSFNYFMIYNFISLNMFIMFYIFNINNLNQLNNMKMFKSNLYLINFLMIMSLSGLPPFFGFMMKWLSIQLFIELKLNFYFFLIFIFNSLISMFFYLRIMFSLLMSYYMINKINIKFINMNMSFNFKIIYLNWFMFTLILLYEIF